MLPRVTVRTAEDADASFAYAVREKAMRQYVEATWGEWNEDDAKRQIASDLLERRLKIVEADLQPVGMMRVDENVSSFDVDQMFLMPEYQNRGIGTELLQGVLAAAQKKNVPVRLWVLKVNPARRLYERLGFHIFEETPASLHLQRAA
jgi:GNAT superfamily N-acetyltransferase